MSDPTDVRPHTLVSLSSATGDRISVVNSSSTQLLVTFGQIDGEPEREVLVGLVDFALFATSATDEPEAPIQLTLTVENMSFLLADMTRDFAGVCEGLAKLSSDKAPVDASRLQTMQGFLAKVRESVDEAEKALNNVTV